MKYTRAVIKKKILDGTIYKTRRYKAWRKKIFRRDHFQCRWCKAKGYIQAHHIRPKYKHPSLIFKINNGITLCRKCHNKVYQKEAQYARLFKRLLRTKNAKAP